MAILRERLRRKNDENDYDTVYLETSAAICMMADGTTVQTKIDELVTQVSAGSSGGTATKLETPRTIMVSLGSSTSTAFDGSMDVNIGVTGTLGLGNGGTGKTTAPLALYALINGSSALASSGLADTDVLALGDVSAATGKKVTLANLKSYMGVGGGSAGATTIPTAPVSVGNVGTTVSWAGYTWLVVHKANGVAILAMQTIFSVVAFGDSNVYAGSRIETECRKLDMSLGFVHCDYVISWRIGKSFIPSYYETNGGFSHYNSNAKRVATYNGEVYPWFTSSASGDGFNYVYTVLNSGGPKSDESAVNQRGFRPHVAIAF